tara:strand:+ start:1758 stop:2441 length:684 start_codon:yes stop_codon:yes gene_type:complete
MRAKHFKEGLADMANKVELDHEVQMARSDLYKIAKYSIKLHEMLKNVSEEKGLEGWVQAKITKAADYMSSVFHNMDYEQKFADQPMESKNTPYKDTLNKKLEESKKKVEDKETKESGLQYYTGVKKYGKDGMKAIQSAAGKGANHEEIGKIKDKHDKRKKKNESFQTLEESVGKEITEDEFDRLAEKKDACYHKVKARYKVWPSAYASGALVQCRKKGAKNWGNKSK